MLFPEEHAPHLKKWIVKRLENTCDFRLSVSYKRTLGNYL